MRGAILGVMLTAAVLMPAAAGFGQWLKLPTEGVPRNRDGTPNLKAPAPRLSDGKPDFSGIWHAGNRNPCRPGSGDFIVCESEIGGSRQAIDLGIDLPGGLPYQPWAAELTRKRAADDSRDDPHVRCLPDNPPRHWTLPHLSRAIHTPKLLALLYEVNAMYRQIHIDGRPLPADMNPSWMGYSTARWEGDTLVVRTEGLVGSLWSPTEINIDPRQAIRKIPDMLRQQHGVELQFGVHVSDISLPRITTTAASLTKPIGTGPRRSENAGRRSGITVLLGVFKYVTCKRRAMRFVRVAYPGGMAA